MPYKRGVEVTRPVLINQPNVRKEKWDRDDPLYKWLNSLPAVGSWMDNVYTAPDNNYIGWAYPDPDPIEPPTPRNHRSTLVFESEVPEMHRTSKRLLPPLLGGDEYIHEFSYGKSGPTRYSTDLVVVQIHPNKLDRRLRIAGSEPLISRTNRMYGYWDILRNGPYSKQHFVEEGKYNESTSATVWNWLAENRWVVTNNSGWGTVVPYPNWTTVHAVELKQRKYEKAKEQVQRASERKRDDITGYADYEWVGLDAGTLKPAIESGEFGRRPDGVGLIAIDKGGAIILEQATGTGFLRDGLMTRDRIWLEETILGMIDPREYLTEWEQNDVDEVEGGSGSEATLTAFANGDP